MQISSNIEDLFRRLIAIEQAEQSIDDNENKIVVDDIVSKLAFVYEKIRNTMDYQEDHLLRRFAIERNIKRRIVLETLKPKIARSMIEELIRSGYIKNETLADSHVTTLEAVLNKYAYMIELIQNDDEISNKKEKTEIIKWLAGIAACEIDLKLIPEVRADALIETLYNLLKDRIKFRGESISSREKNIQLYITIHKELVKSDNPIISYHLLNLYFPRWTSADQKMTEFVASKITSVYFGIEQHLSNPIRRKLAKSLKRQIVVFKVLRELVNVHQNELIDLFSNPDLLAQEARRIIERNYLVTKQRLRRTSIRAIIYILITKVALAIVLEYPYDLKFIGHVNYVALFINILFPTLLIFVITLSARMPRLKNTKIIIDELLTIVYGDPGKDILCELKVRRKQGTFYSLFEYLFYVALYGFIFGIIIYILNILEFNILSGAIFIFFVTAVSFFGTRIRQMTKDFAVESLREGITSMLITFISLPLIRAGHWLSINMRRFNLFTFILDFLIEAPFKLLVEMIESWFIFLREKKEDTYKST